MKYLKTFDNNLEYNVNDYVLLKNHFVNKNFSLLGKIEDTSLTNNFKIKRFKIVDKPIKDWSIDWYTYQDIIRKLTPEEIDLFKLKEDVTKYNL